MSVLFIIGIVLVSDFSFAQYAETPEKTYAVLGSEALIPCVSDAPISDMEFKAKQATPFAQGRASTVSEEGDPNVLMLIFPKVALEDSGTYECIAGRSRSEAELVVFGLSFPNVVVELKASSGALVKWNRPIGSRDAITSYQIDVTEVANAVGVAVFEVGVDPNGGEQQFVLEDLKPGATYDIEVSAYYLVGPLDEEKTVQGPKSAKVRIETPNFTSPPVMVKAAPWRNSSILVTWKKPTNLDPRSIDGYKVVYKALSRKKDAQRGEMNVTSSGGDGQLKAVLEGLKTRTRYEITVYAIQSGVLGRKSQKVIFRHDGFAPELSIKAVALGPNIAMVTIETVGGNDLKKLRVLYADDSATKWTRIAGCTVGRHCIVAGLQPRSKYFFSARARLNRKTRQVVTHLMTPPTALDLPLDLKVAAQTDHSIKTQWTYAGWARPVGFIVKLDVKETDDQDFRPFKQEVVFNVQSADVDGLQSQDQYRATVVPFDVNGMGVASESVLFQIAPAGIDGTTPAPEFTPPRFIETPEKTMQINAGDNLTLACTALGVPHPKVSWIANGSVISPAKDRRNVLDLYSLQESTTITCQANNMYGTIFHVVRVDVTHGVDANSIPLKKFQKPTIAEQLPSAITRRKGDPFHLRCRFDGNPAPMVTWFQMGRPIGHPTQGESVLAIPSLEKSSTLRCEGRNAFGVSNHIVQLTVENTNENLQERDHYAISLRHIQMSPHLTVIKWVIDEGDLDAIRSFDVSMSSEWNEGLMSQQLQPDQRSINLNHLTAGVKHTVKLETNTHQGKVDEATIDFVPAKMPEADEALLLLEAVEIRHNRARIDFTPMTPVRRYRLRVKDLNVRELGNTILDRNLDGASTSINLQRLKPKSQYQVILDATPTNRFDPITANVIFVTPPVGGVGISVASRSDEELQTTASIVTTTTLPPTTTTRLTTAATTMTTTLAPPTTLKVTDAPFEATDKSYDLKGRTTNKTPYKVDIRWTVNRGDIDAIGHFLVTIKGQRGFTLLEQQVERLQRSITIQSLSPSSRYFINIKLRSADGSTVLAEDDIVVMTPSADAVVDTRNPFLEFEANEIRPSSARLEWAVINGDMRQVSGYRLKVLDRDPNGANLLTQDMASSSLSINLRSLPSNRQFHAILEALDRSRQVLVTSSLTFSTPYKGGYGTPVKASRRSSSPGQLERLRMATTQAPDREPVLEMEIRPELPDRARLNWTMHSGGRRVSSYKIKVHIEGPSGRELLRKRIPLHSPYFAVTGLRPKSTYYMVLEAVDRRGKTLAEASSTYKLPPPGHNVEPIKAFSNMTDDSQDEGNSETPKALSISYIAPVNSTSAIVGWRSTAPVARSDSIMLRYAKFEGNNRRGYKIKYSSASHGRMTIMDLEPASKYGFQIAAAVPQGRYLQWSALVFHETRQ